MRRMTSACLLSMSVTDGKVLRKRKEDQEEEEADEIIRRQDSIRDISNSMGGAAISPAIVAAARYAVMVAADVQQQMRCCMPAVVDNQLQKFETDPEIRQLVGPSQIAFAGLPHAPPMERRNALLQSCTDRQQPHLPITFTQFGYNSDFPLSSCTVGQEEITFESRFILNGVCVILRGMLNREMMTGSSTLQFDEEKAAEQEIRRQQAMQQYGDRIQAIRQRFNLPQS
ncbi:Protein big brother [Dirofilaria immitis]|nr:Protein big brother [Dirofilaria immitis]